jgi:hypothetical protein
MDSRGLARRGHVSSWTSRRIRTTSSHPEIRRTSHKDYVLGAQRRLSSVLQKECPDTKKQYITSF